MPDPIEQIADWSSKAGEFPAARHLTWKEGSFLILQAVCACVIGYEVVAAMPAAKRSESPFGSPAVQILVLITLAIAIVCTIGILMNRWWAYVLEVLPAGVLGAMIVTAKARGLTGAGPAGRNLADIASCILSVLVAVVSLVWVVQRGLRLRVGKNP